VSWQHFDDPANVVEVGQQIDEPLAPDLVPRMIGQEVAPAVTAAPAMTMSRHSRNRSSTVRPGWK
jgi:hypothetical protein